MNIISKSGTTTEPAIAFRIFKEMLESKYGKEGAASRIYATTDKAKGAGLTPVFLDDTVAFEEANLTFTLKKLSKHFIDKDGFISPEIKERWYKNDDYHYMFIGEIKNIYVEDTDITVVDNVLI